MAREGSAVARGVRSLYQAAAGEGRVRVGARPRGVDATDVGPDPSVSAPPLITTAAGDIAGFDDSMRLLGDAGVPVAPYVVVGEGDASA